MKRKKTTRTKKKAGDDPVDEADDEEVKEQSDEEVDEVTKK